MSLSDNNLLDIKEKVNLLFNNYLGFTSTDETKPYYDEDETFNNYIIGDEILIDIIPSAPNFNNTGVFNEISSNNFTIYTKLIKDISFITLLHDISINHNQTYNKYTNNSVQKYDNTDGLQVLLKFNRLKLTRLEGLNDNNQVVSGFNALYKTTDNTYINLLEDTIQFNYNKTSESAPYQWTIEYYNGSRYVDVTPTQGSNIFDIKSGVITFFDWNTSAFNNDLKNSLNQTIDLQHISNNLYVTFVKYIGRKGISNLQKQLDTENINVNIIDISNDSITLLSNHQDINTISGSGIKITKSGSKSLLYYSNGDKWVTNSNIQSNNFIGELSGNATTSYCVKGINNGSITIKNTNLLDDLSTNGGIKIYPNNYNISRTPLFNGEFFIKFNIYYISSWEANQRIKFYVEKSINNIDYTDIYQTTYLGSKNASGPFQNSIIIEIYDQNISNLNTYYYRLSYQLENNTKNNSGILGNNNLIMIQEYSN